MIRHAKFEALARVLLMQHCSGGKNMPCLAWMNANSQANSQPISGLVGTLEKALEAGQTLRREDYLRLFVAYFSQAKTRQDQGYGLDQGQGFSQPPRQA